VQAAGRRIETNGGAGMIEVWKANYFCCECGTIRELNVHGACDTCGSFSVCPATIEKKKEVEADAAKVIPD
jgi:hypothetical protein